MEQEGSHDTMVMLLLKNHSADQSAFLDLCVFPSASILLFFLLFLLFSTHSNISAVLIFILKNCLRLYSSLCYFSICVTQCKANNMGIQNVRQNALRPFFTGLEPQFVAWLKA